MAHPFQGAPKRNINRTINRPPASFGGLKQKNDMHKKKKIHPKVSGCIVECIESATFCNEVSPHQELVDKIRRFDLSRHTPQECLDFVCELKMLIKNYG